MKFLSVLSGKNSIISHLEDIYEEEDSHPVFANGILLKDFCDLKF